MTFPDSAAATGLLTRLRSIVGRRSVLTGRGPVRRFATGYRYGGGAVLAVVRPRSLIAMWRSLEALVEADTIIIMQSANTGLTGGSTPDGGYDRPVVIVNTMRIKGIHPIDDGRQVVCLPGTTLNELEAALRPLGREPHSVIGSSCIGASVFGGICNNSGGSLIQRGPAFTELALFARVDSGGRLELVNHLGIALGSEVESILHRVETGTFEDGDIAMTEIGRASDHDYCDHVRQVDAATPARYNADPTRLYEASGSAGKIALLAVRLDTFPMERDTRTFYIGTNSVSELADLRRDLLQRFDTLPIAAEYIHCDAFDLAAKYGKDTVLAIEYLGTSRLPKLFAAKAAVDGWAERLPFIPANFSDRLLQAAARMTGDHLPATMRAFRDRFEHHLILKMGADGIEDVAAYLAARFPSADGDYFTCNPAEASKAFLHRFAVAGAAVRYRALFSDEVEDIIALDIALRRNDRAWFETLAPEIDRDIVHKIYYGHFLCHVFHQDYIVRKGVDPVALEHEMLKAIDLRGAEYPAEHNVGHLYKAKDSLVRHYRALDPSNRFNPGIGKTARGADWTR